MTRQAWVANLPLLPLPCWEKLGSCKNSRWGTRGRHFFPSCRMAIRDCKAYRDWSTRSSRGAEWLLQPSPACDQLDEFHAIRSTMRLPHVQVQNYRWVRDTGLYEVERSQTILVGPNEAGKTAMLDVLQVPPG